jgi:PEGA domain
MSAWLFRIALVLWLVSGCTTIKDMGLHSTSKAAVTVESPALKYAATLRINNYVDQRKVANPRLLGTAELPVRGIDGKQMLLDQDIAAIVTTVFKQRFDTAGYQVLEDHALFELTGVIKDLVLNVKNRDEIYVAIESTLKETATGKVLWSGLITEKNDRFAGVSGNNRDDVISYMNKSLRIVSTKTADAVSAALMAARPELYSPGAKPATTAPARPAPVMPVESTPRANASAGLLLVNTNPSRAKVYLDGVYYGLSPLRNEMEPGIYTVSVKLEGYRMVSEKVSLRKGDTTEMELNLEK